jgi:hypothetical protein
MNMTDEELAQVGLNLADPVVNRLMYEVLTRPDAAEALEYIVDVPAGGFAGNAAVAGDMGEESG